MIEIYTDGSCDPNPGPGGWAVIVVKDGKEVTRISGRADHTTNNAMELRALLEATQFAKGGAATIYSDSQYALNCLKWAVGWKARGWRKADGKEIANLDLVKALHAADRPHFRWTWVRGHNGNKWNEEADRLAEQARQAAPASRLSCPNCRSEDLKKCEHPEHSWRCLPCNVKFVITNPSYLHGAKS